MCIRDSPHPLQLLPPPISDRSLNEKSTYPQFINTPDLGKLPPNLNKPPTLRIGYEEYFFSFFIISRFCS